MTSVNKILNNMKRWMMGKKEIKKTIKLFIFFIIISLPFVTITQMIGMDTFLDSFENPDQYLCFQDNGDWFGVKTEESKYIIIQKATHPDFTIEDSDSIIYFKINGDITCSKIKQTNTYISSIKRYSPVNSNEEYEENIYESQIIGKIVNRADDNIWNILSIKIWEVSIHNLNIRALMTK